MSPVWTIKNATIKRNFDNLCVTGGKAIRHDIWILPQQPSIDLSLENECVLYLIVFTTDWHRLSMELVPTTLSNAISTNLWMHSLDRIKPWLPIGICPKSRFSRKSKIQWITPDHSKLSKVTQSYQGYTELPKVTQSYQKLYRVTKSYS